MGISEKFFYESPRTGLAPILISAPHTGTEIPDDIRACMNPAAIANLDDTDWCIHDLYDFMRDHGVGIIHARYSRLVIDLNRSPKNEKLYSDQRQETGIIPRTTFDGQNIYLPERSAGSEELNRRLEAYYRPYHAALQDHLSRLREKFDHVLLYDAHSIARFVPSINALPFPDLILGTNQETSADPKIIAAAWHVLKSSAYSAQHNQPFRGGYITRNYGQPKQGIHALQLERSKDIYLKSDAQSIDPAKATKLRLVLEAMLVNILKTLASLNSK